MKPVQCLIFLLVVPAAIFTCSAPPPPHPESIPPPPPAYGPDPFQTAGYQGASLAAPAAGVRTVSIGAGAYAAPQPMSEEQALSYIAAFMESRTPELSKGFEYEGEISSEKVSAGDEKRFAVATGKGRCLRLIAAADPGMPNIDMYLYDGQNLLDRDVGADNYPVVSSCFKQEKEVTLVLKVVSGSGWFLVKVWSRKDDGTVKRTMDALEKASSGK